MTPSNTTNSPVGGDVSHSDLPAVSIPAGPDISNSEASSQYPTTPPPPPLHVTPLRPYPHLNLNHSSPSVALPVLPDVFPPTCVQTFEAEKSAESAVITPNEWAPFVFGRGKSAAKSSASSSPSNGKRTYDREAPPPWVLSLREALLRRKARKMLKDRSESVCRNIKQMYRNGLGCVAISRALGLAPSNVAVIALSPSAEVPACPPGTLLDRLDDHHLGSRAIHDISGPSSHHDAEASLVEAREWALARAADVTHPTNSSWTAFFPAAVDLSVTLLTAHLPHPVTVFACGGSEGSQPLSRMPLPVTPQMTPLLSPISAHPLPRSGTATAVVDAPPPTKPNSIPGDDAVAMTPPTKPNSIPGDDAVAELDLAKTASTTAFNPPLFIPSPPVSPLSPSDVPSGPAPTLQFSEPISFRGQMVTWAEVVPGYASCNQVHNQSPPAIARLRDFAELWSRDFGGSGLILCLLGYGSGLLPGASAALPSCCILCDLSGTSAGEAFAASTVELHQTAAENFLRVLPELQAQIAVIYALYPSGTAGGPLHIPRAVPPRGRGSQSHRHRHPNSLPPYDHGYGPKTRGPPGGGMLHEGYVGSLGPSNFPYTDPYALYNSGYAAGVCVPPVYDSQLQSLPPTQAVPFGEMDSSTDGSQQIQGFHLPSPDGLSYYSLAPYMSLHGGLPSAPMMGPIHMQDDMRQYQGASLGGRMHNGRGSHHSRFDDDIPRLHGAAAAGGGFKNPKKEDKRRVDTSASSTVGTNLGTPRVDSTTTSHTESVRDSRVAKAKVKKVGGKAGANGKPNPKTRNVKSPRKGKNEKKASSGADQSTPETSQDTLGAWLAVSDGTTQAPTVGQTAGRLKSTIRKKPISAYGDY